jgi:hypothetical protein
MLDRCWCLWNRRRSADQTDEVVVVLAGLEDIGVHDANNHEERQHHRLPTVAENEPAPTSTRLGKKA